MKKILHNQMTENGIFSKKLLLIAALLVALVSTSFAEPKVSAKAVQHLSKEYKDASNIKWVKADNYTKASFEWNHQPISIFYDEAGEYIGASRPIKLTALPLAAQKNLNERFPEYTPLEAVEFDDNQNSIDYYVSMETNKRKLILKISSAGEVSIYKKTRK